MSNLHSVIKINFESYRLNAHFLSLCNCLDTDVLDISINKIVL